jgi:hypothetical protein
MRLTRRDGQNGKRSDQTADLMQKEASPLFTETMALKAH